MRFTVVESNGVHALYFGDQDGGTRLSGGKPGGLGNVIHEFTINNTDNLLDSIQEEIAEFKEKSEKSSLST